MSETAMDQPQHVAQGSDSLRRKHEDFERRRQVFLLYLYNGVAVVFLSVFGVAAILTGRYMLAGVTIGLDLVSITNILILRFTDKGHLARNAFVFGLVTLYVYLLASGGVEQTGPLWAYPIVLATITLQGLKRGLPLVGLMFGLAFAIFFLPMPWFELASYSVNFKARWLATLLSLVVFTTLHEYARARNQDELVRVSGRLDQLSRTDQLTSVPNRRYMMDRLEAENSRFQRNLRPYSILYGDVDNFKSINDQYGHQTGDAVLQAIARAMRPCLRQHDEVSRWGGEEFLILLPETNHAAAAEVAEKLRATIAALEFHHVSGTVRLTMSFGIHTVEQPGAIDNFIHEADQNLSRAKRSGKNCVVGGLTREA
jgi:diguanylate cyclase (GGDEF)-like protein